jgi:hypothetical protein
MKKVILTAVAVLAFWSFSNNTQASNLTSNEVEFRDCIDVYMDAYIYALETLNTDIDGADMYAAVAFMTCTGNFF